jgi:hypothetical protein
LIRRVYILVEGQTEEEFVSTILCPYLFDHAAAFDVRPIVLETSPGHKGGLVNYVQYQNTVKRFLKAEKDILVTSMVDFYGLPPNFPGFLEAKRLIDPNDKVQFVEQEVAKDIDSDRFLPYIQLHEFEALLFVSSKGFRYLSEITPGGLKEVDKLLSTFPNPELINDRPHLAPSKRIKNILYDYKKPIDGIIIALENGIQATLDRCPRFRSWVETLIEKIQGSAGA